MGLGRRRSEDVAGALGWFSRRGVVNLDGLVSDFSLLEARRANAVGPWVERAGVRWFADCVPRGETEAYARSIGRAPSTIREVLRVDGGRCDGVLWELVGASVAAAVPATATGRRGAP